MAFEVFDKRQAPLAKAPSVTIQRKGIFSLNRAAHALLGGSETVELLFDREDNVIGIRPADASVPHAYIVRPQSANKETGPLILAGTAFCTFYGIDTTVSKRWTPSMDGQMLLIDLKQPGSEIIGNRSGRTTADTQEA